MTADATRSVRDIQPIDFDTDARAMASAVYDQLASLLEQLEPADWNAPTECAPWTVADMVGHVLGAARATASVRESVRQQVWGRRHGDEFAGNALDAVNALQVDDHAGLTAPQRVQRLRELAPAAVRGRMRLPRPLRRVRLGVPQGGSTPAGMPDSLTLGHLMAVVYTRDVWLHRVDIARATGRELELDPAVDGRLVADVVREWAHRHGQPFVLHLPGPAGGRFVEGESGPELDLDPVEFCRALSGREPGEGLLATRIIF